MVAFHLTAAPHAFAAEPDTPGGTWTSSSFLDFVDGTLSDGGVNTYVAADGTVRLINQSDVNGDGHVDIVLPNTHDNDAKVDLYLYWGSNLLSAQVRSQLPTDGGKNTMVADLNGDTFPDLVVVNRVNGTKPDLNSYIYWGSDRGFSAERRDELPTQGAEAAAAADLNGDGFLDLIFANDGLTFHVKEDHFQKSFIYWGTADGYSADQRGDLKTIYARDVAVADLNQDGFLDLVFAVEGNLEQESGAWIYWGNDRGQYVNDRVTRLPGIHSSAVAVADLNGDDRPEIVLANAFRLRARELGIYNIVETSAVSSYVYWASTEGYDPERRTDLPTLKASDVAVHDLNGDDRPDILFANASGGSSTIYWNNGGGHDAHSTFRAHRRTALPTRDAAATAVADLNDDGFADIVFANSSDGHRKETDSFVYWGGRDGFDVTRRLDMPTLGATGVTIADLDRDGKLDVVFAHATDGTADKLIDSYVYWGDRRGTFDPSRRLELLTHGTYGYTAADLDNDGYVDLYFSGHASYIYAGGPHGFSSERRSVLSKRFAFSAVAADFNRDGYLDLSLSEWSPGQDDTSLYWGGPEGYSSGNRFVVQVDSTGRLTQHMLADLDQNGWLDLILPTWKGTILLWNSEHGFDNARRTVLPCAGAVACDVADLNADGHLDIVIANMFKPADSQSQMSSFGGSPQGDTQIYWGAEEGYAQSRCLILPSVGNEDVAIADCNGDGHLDLVLSSYHAGYTRSHPSYVYYNSAQGFDEQRVTMLPTDSASGVMVADYNRDGNQDILFACHKLDGNHRTNSFLYWGSKAGFFPERRSEIPGLGPHFLTAVDPGDIYRRSDRYDYISPPFDAGGPARFTQVAWSGQKPFRTGLEVQVRTAARRDGLSSATWAGPQGKETYFRKSPARLDHLPAGHRWIQYRVSLVSPDSANSPVLESVAIDYVADDEP